MNFSRSLFRAGLFAGLLALFCGLASAQPAAPFAATLQTDTGGALVLHWPSQTGQHYSIEASPI
ncbi:MAG: hypothetical protein IPL39_05570 [Opitutaceae bacterium]|nr:hypothetical protein [Opitutaceae bacterium]